MARTVLLTGASGMVSTALLNSLQGQTSLRLRALVRNPDKASALKARGIELIGGDLDQPESLGRAFEGVNDLWLLNAVSPRQPENSMNALWAARRAGVERVVRLSAIGAAHDAPSRNGRLHALSDAELQRSGLRWTILRPHFFMQNLLATAATIAAQGALYWDMSEGRLGMIDVRDIGDFAARILLAAPGEHDQMVYTLTGPVAVSLGDAASAFSGALGKPVRYVPVSHDAAREGMQNAGLDPWLCGMLVEYSAAYSENWGNFVTPHIRNVLGREARTIRDFAHDHVSAFQAGTR